MNRIAIGLLVAATAGAVTWWTSQRTGRSEALALAAPEPNSSPKPEQPPNPVDKSIITPKHDVDPGMVKHMPDVDPKMVITPPWPPRSREEPSGPIKR